MEVQVPYPLSPRNSVQGKCRHSQGLWHLSADRQFILCGDCGIRVGAVVKYRIPRYHWEKRLR